MMTLEGLKPMKAVLLRGALLFPKWHASSVSAIPDLGLAYLAATFESEGHLASIIDAPGEGIEKLAPLEGTSWMMQGLTPEEVVSRIPHDVDVIGLSSMHSHRWPVDRQIARLVLERFPDIPLLIGGEHATACFKEIIEEFPQVFAVIKGEGEDILKDLCLKQFDKESRFLVSGIAFYDEDQNRITQTESRERIERLDDLPFPSWKGVPLENYFKAKSGINSFSQKSLPIMASRGCAHACYFCTAPQMWKKEWHQRSPESLVKEMEKNYKQYGVKHFDFVDLNLGCDKRFIEELAKKIQNSSIPFTWALPIGTRAEGLDEELIKLLAKSGLQRVLFSPESNSEMTQELINKHYNLKHFLKVVRACVKEGIIVKIAFVVGFPEQRKSDLWQNVKLALKLAVLGIHDVVSLIFIPYPGTVLFHKLKVTYDYRYPHANLHLNSDLKMAKSWSEHLSDSELKKFVWLTMGGFYLLQFILRPWRIVMALGRICLGRPTTNFESLLSNTFKLAKNTWKGV